MDIVLKVGAPVVLLYGFYTWLRRRQKRVAVEIHPATIEAKPVLYCDIFNHSEHTITIDDCHLIVNDNHSALRGRNLPLPYTFPPRHGGGWCFDALSLLTKTNGSGQGKFKVQAFFHGSTGTSYLSKPLVIETHPGGESVFDDRPPHLSLPAESVVSLAQALTDQLGQQLVGIPYVLLGLIREEQGVGGHILRELGLQEDFLLNLAESWPNLPRDPQFPFPYQSEETQDLIHEYMRVEACKMHQKCMGTGHLLLGLIKQRNEVFLKVLQHLNIKPRKLRGHVYQVLRRNSHVADRPTAPPEGAKRLIWAISYSYAHAILKLFWRVVLWLYPDLEI